MPRFSVVMNVGQVEQIGTPEEIYDRPATLFVNRFMGHANVFSATPTGGDSLCLATGETVRLDRAVPFRSGAEVVLTARPEHLAIASSKTPGGIAATWLRAAPLAQFLSVELALADGTAVKALVDRHDGPRFAPGEAVSLTLDTARLQLFPNSSPTVERSYS